MVGNSPSQSQGFMARGVDAAIDRAGHPATPRLTSHRTLGTFKPSTEREAGARMGDVPASDRQGSPMLGVGSRGRNRIQAGRC